MNVEEFTRLHVPGDPLLLANAWDLGSARYLFDAGFPVIASTSAGVAYAANKRDAHGETFAETLALAKACQDAGIPLTVDLESGFSDDIERAAANVAAFAEAGVLGVNIEDGRPDGSLLPIEAAVAKIRAIRALTPGIFINARTDSFWRSAESDEERKYAVALERARAFTAAGAHGIFVPGVSTPATIEKLAHAIDAPLNVLFTPGALTLAQLAELGVGRVSLGSMLFRLSLGAIAAAANEVRTGRYLPSPATPSYGELNG